VAGGSLANGFVGLKTDVFLAASGDFRGDVAPLAKALSRGTLWRSPLTYAYVVLLVAILVAATVLCFPLEGVGPFVVWVAALVLVGWLVGRRGSIAAHAFDRSLFRGADLARLNPTTDHVIGTCDLQTAESVFFSGRFVYSYRLGWGVPGDLPLARAVQASACPAGVFAPRVTPIARHRFSLAGAGDDPLTHLVLTDGRVSDSLGAEWPLGLAARAREGGAPNPPPHTVDEVVVVDASAGPAVSARRSVTTPIVGELTSMLAVDDVLAEQSTSVRRRLLDVRFRATRAGVGDGEVLLAGGMVQIERSPYELPRSFASGHDDRARRARVVLDVLTPGEEPAWRAETEANRGVRTGLRKIPADRAARLMRHAYVLTMVNMHVLHDYPLFPVPGVAEFEKLVA
jgi:hypothetical protein